jgi:ATP-dependent DNA helicase RecG
MSPKAWLLQFHKRTLIIKQIKLLSLLQLKKQRKNKITNVFDIKDNLSNQLHQHLGFALTNAQQRSIVCA